MNFPGVIIIGAQKCGTSSLHKYLDRHPDIQMSAQKELNFFSEEYQWKKGADWYKRQFTGNARIFGESSPGYTMYPVRQGVPQRMYELVPDAKLIYLVRDPIKRMISHYLDRFKGGREQRPVEQALLDPGEDNFYIHYSQYYAQLSRYLEFYPRSAIHVETASRLKNDRQAALRDIFRFLGVDPEFTCQEFEKLHNVSDVKLKRRKPRRIVRRFLLDKHSIYPRLKPWLAVLIPKASHAAIIDGLIPGTAVARPRLDDAIQVRIRERLADDLRRFRDLTGIDFTENAAA